MRFRSAFYAGVAFALALATAPLAHAQTTALYFDSQAGDYIGAGPPPRTYTPPDATFAVSRYRNGVSLRVDGPTLAYWWTLTFVAVDDAPLAVGSYVSARRAPFASPYNGLDVSGSGRGCNDLTGRFVVREIEYPARMSSDSRPISNSTAKTAHRPSSAPFASTPTSAILCLSAASTRGIS